MILVIAIIPLGPRLALFALLLAKLVIFMLRAVVLFLILYLQ